MFSNPKISVVTPTLNRSQEVADLLHNLGNQALLPFELILVDGAPPQVTLTEKVVTSLSSILPYSCYYIRHGGGTAIQRNVGIDVAKGDFIAFIDDDIRLEPDFFEQIITVYREDTNHQIGGIAGYITNQHLDIDTSPRWRWYKRLRLFTTYEPGRYDYQTGYPINRYLQAPYTGVRLLDFMGAGCAIWRSQVFAEGLRFGDFFSDYGVLEDAHFALRAGRQWTLLECGNARCIHLYARSGRSSERTVARKTAINYRYVFVDIVRHRSWRHELRFWRVQLIDLVRITMYALRYMKTSNWLSVLGKLEGIVVALFVRASEN